jgi:hypothetical protein
MRTESTIFLNNGTTPTQDEEQVPQDEGMDQGGHKKKYHRHLQLKSGPPSKGII